MIDVHSRITLHKMTAVYNVDLQIALSSNNDREFFRLARELIQNGNPDNVFSIFMVAYNRESRAQMDIVTQVHTFNRETSVNGNVIAVFPNNYQYRPLLNKRLHIQAQIDSGMIRIDEQWMNPLITDKKNYLDLPVYYSACDPNQVQIREVYERAKDSMPNGAFGNEAFLGIVIMQLTFTEDAIANFGSLDKIPIYIWQLKPFIGDCYADLFHWHYFEGKQTVAIPWNEIFTASQSDIRSRINEWLEDIARIIETERPVYTSMPDDEWMLLVEMMIDYGYHSVVNMRRFGKVNEGRSIKVRIRPTHIDVYRAAIAALAE